MSALEPQQPIDLRPHFGERYRVRCEAHGERSAWPEAEKPWLAEILCRYGFIYPFGGQILAACTDRPRIGARLRRLPFILSVRGDLETVVRFAVDDIEVFLAILKPYRRRRLSEALRVKNVEILARARQQRRESLTQDDFAELGSTQASLDDLEVQPELEVLLAVAEVTPSEGAGAGRKLAAGEGVP